MVAATGVSIPLNSGHQFEPSSKTTLVSWLSQSL